MNTNKTSTGNGSTGDYSTGNRSTGYWSTGNRSTGDRSAGNYSTGYRSTGDRSTGNWSTGDYSTGYCSTGNRSTGYWSISNYSTGHFSTIDYSGFGCFDLPCTLEEWDDWEAPTWLYFDLTVWIDEKNMTDKEKEDNPSYKTTGGYLKVLDYKEAAQASYNKASQEDKDRIKLAPNYAKDPENAKQKIFEIFGIKIDEEETLSDKTVEIDGKTYKLTLMNINKTN